jgi:hypothetical protein
MIIIYTILENLFFREFLGYMLFFYGEDRGERQSPLGQASRERYEDAAKV